MFKILIFYNLYKGNITHGMCICLYVKKKISPHGLVQLDVLLQARQRTYNGQRDQVLSTIVLVSLLVAGSSLKLLAHGRGLAWVM
jgi:hypothetical protein